MIGYYVHHHGRGHETRMRCIAAQLTRPVTVLSSLASAADETLPWVHLPRDDGPGSGDPTADVTAGGRLHWAPRHDRGLAERSASIAGWIAEHRPELMVVDVSVEVAALARLCGVPVAVLAMPGRRDDAAHSLGYDVADALIAAWPAGVGVPRWWPRAWVEKTTFVGAISRFDGWVRPAVGTAGRDAGATEDPAGPRRRGLLLWGAGGGPLGEQVLASLRAGSPGWHWDVAGLGHRLDAEETWRALGAADVVVTHGGQNTVAEVAAARRPAVVVADDRPFAEQHSTTARLSRAGLAATFEGCPPPAAWPGLLRTALSTDPARWSWWNDGDGAARGARALETTVEATQPVRAAAGTVVPR